MTIGSHQTAIGKSQVHLTPRWIIERLGPFFMDPCAADPRPWDCASVNYTIEDNGLSKPWGGMVWLNPPFDRRVVGQWMERLAAHGRGIALIHARTETDWFLPCWQRASAMLFMANRIKFFKPNGKEQKANSGAPVVLVAFGGEARRRLETSGIAGAIVTNWQYREAA